MENILNAGSKLDIKWKYLTGEWFYEAKSRRHMDKIHGSDIILASMKQQRSPLGVSTSSCWHTARLTPVFPHSHLTPVSLPCCHKVSVKHTWVSLPWLTCLYVRFIMSIGCLKLSEGAVWTRNINKGCQSDRGWLKINIGLVLIDSIKTTTKVVKKSFPCLPCWLLSKSETYVSIFKTYLNCSNFLEFRI